MSAFYYYLVPLSGGFGCCFLGNRIGNRWQPRHARRYVMQQSLETICSLPLLLETKKFLILACGRNWQWKEGSWDSAYGCLPISHSQSFSFQFISTNLEHLLYMAAYWALKKNKTPSSPFQGGAGETVRQIYIYTYSPRKEKGMS